MHLPNAKNAYIDLRKLTDYALDPESPRGRHKARVFKSALGFTAENASELCVALLFAILESACTVGESDFYGQRYTVDCKITSNIGEAVVRTAWIIRRGEDFPRLTTCFVIADQGGQK